MAGLLAIVTANEEEYNKLANAIDNSTGSAKNMQDIMEDTLHGDFKKFTSAVRDLAIGFGKILEPSVRTITQSLTNLVNKFANMSEGSKKTLINITALGMGFGILLTAIGTVTKVSGLAMIQFSKFGRSLASLATKLGMTSIQLLGVVGGLTALAGAFVYTMTYEERANKKLQEFNKTLAENNKQSTENIKQHTSDINQAKQAMLEIEVLEEKLSKTKNKDERLQIEGEIINKKKELISLMPEVTEGMDAETSTQQELNKALQDYIDKKNEAIAIEKRSQLNDARKFLREDGNKNLDILGTASAKKDLEFIDKQLDEISKYADDTKHEGSGMTYGTIRERLEKDRKNIEEKFENNTMQMEQWLEMYDILEQSGSTIPASMKKQKEEIEKYMNGIEFKDVDSKVAKAYEETFGILKEGAKSSKKSLEDFNKIVDEVLATNLPDNMKKGMEKFKTEINSGRMTVEDFDLTMGLFETTASKNFGSFDKIANATLDSLFGKFGDGKITLGEFQRSINSLDMVSSEKFKNLGENANKSMDTLIYGFYNGDISLDTFEASMNSMALYAEQDFSKLDDKSKATIDNMMTKLPEGGQAIADFELAINGMAIKSSLDMNNFDKATQNNINSIVAKFNEGNISANDFLVAMELMSVLSTENIKGLSDSSKTNINNLISDFINGKTNIENFTNGVLTNLGISGVKISEFSSLGQQQLVNLIGQFLNGKISIDDFNKMVGELKSNPQFYGSMQSGMNSTKGSVDGAKSSLDGFNRSWDSTPDKQEKNNYLNTHKTTIETTVQKSGTQGGSGSYSDKHAGIGKRSMPIGIEGNSGSLEKPTTLTRDSILDINVGNEQISTFASNPNNSNNYSSSNDSKRQEEDAQRERERMESSANSNIEKMRDKLYKALKAKIEKQKQAELDLHDSRIEALKKEKDLLNNEQESDYKSKVDALKEEKKMWEQNDSAFAKQKVKELEEKIKQAEKDLRNKQIDDEIEAIEKEKQAVEKSYEERLKDKELYNEANKLLLSKNITEMKDLLVEYAPEFDHLGALYGETMAEAFNRELKDAMNAWDFMNGKKDKFEEGKAPWESSKPNNSSGGSSSSSNSNNSNTNSNSKKGKVTTNTLNVREGAGTNYKAIGSVYKNEEVDILDEKNGWYKIEYYSTKYKKNRQGWSSSSYIKKFHTGGIIGKMSSDEGLAMVQTGERVLSREQTGSYDDFVYKWLPQFESIMGKFTSLKTNDNVDNSNQILNFYNTYNVDAANDFKAEKLASDVVKHIEDKARRFGVNLKPVAKVRVKN